MTYYIYYRPEWPGGHIYKVDRSSVTRIGANEPVTVPQAKIRSKCSQRLGPVSGMC